MKRIFFVFLFLVSLVSCATTGSMRREKPEIKEVDGTYSITNRDSNNNPFVTDSVFISSKFLIKSSYMYYYPKEISVWIFGADGNGKNQLIVDGKIKIKYSDDPFDYMMEYAENNSFDKQNLAYNLADFDKFFITSGTGKILKSDIKVKKGSLYITIKEYDFTKLSSVVEDAQKKAKEEAEAEKKVGREKYAEYCSKVYEEGKKLYEDKIILMQDKKIPVFINSYDISMDSVGGIDVKINFENISNKTIKYVDFAVTPYNRVNDLAYSEIDGVSTRSIRCVDFVPPNQAYKASWRAVWYNSTISYIRIKSVKVTFSDNSTLSVSAENIEKVFKTRELVKEIFNNGKQSLVLKYNVTENKLYANYNLNQSIFMSSIPTYKIYFDTDEYFVKDEKISSYKDQATGSYLTGALTFDLTSAYSDFQLLASAKSGDVRIENRGSLPKVNYGDTGKSSEEEILYRFTDEQLQFIRECASICYYRKQSK